MTFPVVDPDATTATIFVSLQFTINALVPPIDTFPAPSLAPKLDPAMVTWVPTEPERGETEEISGWGGATVKVGPFTQASLACSCNKAEVPCIAVGTTTTTCVSVQLTTVIVAPPLNSTYPPPCVVPNPDPLIVTCDPTGPLVGLMLVITGAATTVMLMLLVCTPPAVTTCTVSLPNAVPAGMSNPIVLLLHEATATDVPFSNTVPCVPPNDVPDTYCRPLTATGL